VDAHHGVATDPHAGQHGHLSANPDVVFDNDRMRLARASAIRGGFGIGEMVANLTRSEDAIGTHVDPLGRHDGAAVEPGAPADADHRLGARGDKAVDLGVRPRVDVGLQHHLPRPLDAQPAIPEQPGSDANARVDAKRQAGKPAETAGGGLFQRHVLAITRQRTTLHAPAVDN